MTEDIESIRRRPGMYVGDLHDGSGLLHTLWEALGNAIDEHLAGHASQVRVTIEADDSLVVEDDGRGIHPALAMRALTELHDTNTLDGHHPHVHLGQRGLGLSVVSALSASCVVESRREGRLFRARLERGVPALPMHDAGPTDARGTRITFQPDPEIFSRTRVDLTAVQARIDELGAFLPELSLELAIAARTVRPGRGIAALLEPHAALHPPLEHRGGDGRIAVELALALTETPWARVRSFVNTRETREGGTHHDALVDAVRRFFATCVEPERFVRAVVHVRCDDPRYYGPVREKLISPEVRAPVTRAALDALAALERAHPDALAQVRALSR